MPIFKQHNCNKTVLMIGGGIQQVDAIHQAHKLGFRVAVTDRLNNSPCRTYADYFAAIDGRDIEKLIAFTLLNKERWRICGVFTLTEMVTSVAAVAQAADLPGTSIASAVICQHKILSKNKWLANNIPTPAGGMADNYDELQKLYRKYGPSVFIKPAIGFGGKGAKQITSVAELTIFVKNTPPKFPVIVERYQHGTMHDVNAVFDKNGAFHPLGCFDRYFHQDFPVETGSCYPSHLSNTEQNKLFDLTMQAAYAVGIKQGPVKADCVLTQNGFKILEMAPRLHGPKGTLLLTFFASGISHFMKALPIITDTKQTLQQQSHVINRVSICQAVLPAQNGFFQGISGISQTTKRKLDKILLLAPKGSRIDKCTDNTKVPAFIFTSGKSFKETKSNVEKIMDGITIDIDT